MFPGSTYEAIVLTAYTGGSALRLETKHHRPLVRGEVRIRMAASPINPSDLMFLKGRYGIRKTLPVVPGFEGSGVAIETKGLRARWLLNKRVACVAPKQGDGSWSEYMIARLDQCVPLRNDVSLDAGASLFVNPLTAWCLLRIAKDRGCGFVQTAAASALGRMLARLAHDENVEAVHVVRREEQERILFQEGSRHVLNTENPHFADQLNEKMRSLNIGIAFDAVGGPLTAQLLNALPYGGEVIVIGALAGENVQASPDGMIFRGQRISGFWLSQWIQRQAMWTKLGMVRNVQARLNSSLKTTVQARFPLMQFDQAIAHYKAHRSEGKVLFAPDLENRSKRADNATRAVQQV